MKNGKHKIIFGCIIFAAYILYCNVYTKNTLAGSYYSKYNVNLSNSEKGPDTLFIFNDGTYKGVDWFSGHYKISYDILADGPMIIFYSNYEPASSAYLNKDIFGNPYFNISKRGERNLYKKLE